MPAVQPTAAAPTFGTGTTSLFGSTSQPLAGGQMSLFGNATHTTTAGLVAATPQTSNAAPTFAFGQSLCLHF